jgi:KDO2-lipid IV(A) lauroyltransferase
MKRLKDFSQTLGAYAFEFGIRLHRALPRSLDLWLTARLGSIFGRLAPGMRAPLMENLRVILGMSEREAQKTAGEVFKNFALTLHDFFIPDQVTIDVPNRERLERARREHGGVLTLTFHLGNWELGARTMQTWGWPVTAVYQPYTNPKFKQLIESHRAPGVNFLPVGGHAAKGVMEALRRGDVVAMLGDHPFGEDGAAVDLLGRRVMWPRGPIVLAVRSGCPIVVAVIVRVGRQHYQAIIEEPMIPRTRTLAEVDRLMQGVAEKFGSVVRSYPTQWYRFRAFEPASASRSLPADEAAPRPAR